MSDVLDLSITLAPPPEGSPPEALAGITLRCEPLGLSHAGDLLMDPLTTDERKNLNWCLEEYWKWPFDVFARRAGDIEGELPNLGKRLYRALFGSAGAVSVVQPWRLQPGVQRQISILSDLPRALSLPWELLHDEQGFLALRAQQPVSILRRLPQSEAASLPAPFTPPLRVLFVTARPVDAGFVDPRTIARELLDEMQEQIEQGAVVLEFLRPPTLEALSERLQDAERPVHVLHFDGHGAFGGRFDGGGLTMRDGAQGMLAFEDDEGKLDLITAEDLAQVLQDGGVRLAMLTACQSALGAEDDAFSSVAARLIGGGVDAVGAISASVLVASATRYAEAFYRALAAGQPAPIAQERARQALHVNKKRHLFRRHRDDEAEFITLRDWWLPHFYQQRPLTLRPETAPSAAEPQPPRFTGFPLDRTGLPLAPLYGFFGRARELLRIERLLLKKKLVAIHGFGGMGKTALAVETADWLSKTGMYHGACFVSYYERGGDATELLRELGRRHMGLEGGDYNPSDHEAALAKLRPALREQPTLVIADNVESILPGGEAALEAPDRTQLWDVMLKLAGMPGCGVLVTTRDTNFGDPRMSGSRHVAHLPLEGLHREDAYALAVELLRDLGIDRRAHAPYSKLRDLLEKLDHHPLAIQLVLPVLHDESLDRIIANFANLLPRFTDDTAAGRNKSLLASLEYSLRRLSAEQRALLPRLASFEGGASEDDLLAVTGIPETEWAILRPVLEQAALLRAEPLPNFRWPFLHFHPVLVPFLRGQPGADDVTLQERYAERYYAVANYLREDDTSNPQAIRLLVRRELPNLRRALNLLLEGGELNGASVLADSMDKFLRVFGLRREREAMNRKVAKAWVAESTRSSETLTQARWLIEVNLGECELERGELDAAYERFRTLLEHIEALPEGAPLGRSSYEHSLTLFRLSRCLTDSGRLTAGESRLREALTAVETRIAQQPDEQGHISHHAALLNDLAHVLAEQGKYQQAREVYDEVLRTVQQLTHFEDQAAVRGDIGRLALMQMDYSEARECFSIALKIFQDLNAPLREATSWHNLGLVAEAQEDWAEAERCYRKGLAISEAHGQSVDAAATYNQLGIVAGGAGRPAEAEQWYKRALGVPNLPANFEETVCNNLAHLLLEGVQKGRLPEPRLTEAQHYAERSLAICETLDASFLRNWNALSALAGIASLQGKAEVARAYRRRERETYAAFEGNRYHINERWDDLIEAIAAAARGDEQARAAVEAALPQIEERGWRIADATRRIWAGERDWQALVEELDRQDALLILRVLETIAGTEPARQE